MRIHILRYLKAFFQPFYINNKFSKKSLLKSLIVALLYKCFNKYDWKIYIKIPSLSFLLFPMVSSKKLPVFKTFIIVIKSISLSTTSLNSFKSFI